MKKLLLAIFAVAALYPLTSKGQDYKSAIGVGLGSDMSINFKHFVSNSSAFEVQLGYNLPHNGVMLSAVYQYHFTLAQGFRLYVGGGVNLGGLDLSNSHHNNDGVFVVGIDPTVGFEYSFARAPIVLALDYKPNINLFNHAPQWDIAALKIRFKI